MMRKITGILAVALTLLGATLAQAAQWKVDTNHSILSFKVRHLFSKVDGRFDDWSASLNFDPDRIEEGGVTVEIQAASVTTDNDRRDADLRSPNFFDVEKYPTLSFKSDKITKEGDGYILHGALSMHGVTKEVSFPFEFNGSGSDPGGNTRAGFSASLSLNRKDYGMVWNRALDSGGMLLGDDVDIDISIEAVESKD